MLINKQVEELIAEWRAKGTPVVGVVTEPIQSEGGDHHGSNYFFQQLQALAKRVSRARIL